MQLRTATWNIGGGRLLEQGQDPTLLSSYVNEDLDSIVATLTQHDPDIIALQEIEGDDQSNQIERIAQGIGFNHYFYDATSASHMTKGKMLGNGIISRYPISNHISGLFHNPDLEFDLEGQIERSHDKGYGECVITIGNVAIRATTLHLLPFRKVGVDFDSEAGKNILESVINSLQARDRYQIVQGDFNMHTELIERYIPDLFKLDGLLEVRLTEPTTPKDRMYDHVLYRGIEFKSMTVDSSVLTDHFPVFCTFEVPE